MERKVVSVPKISCGHCTATIERELGALAGVTKVRADASLKTVEVEWDEARVSWDALRALLVEIDFPPAEN